MAMLSNAGINKDEGKFVVSLTLVRHGESEGNLHKVCSEVGQNLTEKGRAQALLLGDHLKLKCEDTFDLALCSDLNRVKQTADIVLDRLAGTGNAISLRVDPLLREKDQENLQVDHER